MTLTKETIEAWRHTLCGPDLGTEELDEIFDMALNWLAVQPRPIEDAPNDGTKFLAFQKTSEGWEHYDCWWHQGPKDEQYWMDVSDSEPEPTHFIPLTSLPEPKI